MTKCIECGNDSEFNYDIQNIYESSLGSLFIVKCTHCGSFNPFKAMDRHDYNAIQEQSKVAWSRLNSENKQDLEDEQNWW